MSTIEIAAVVTTAALVVAALLSAASLLRERLDRKRIDAGPDPETVKSDPAYFLPGHRPSRPRR